MGNADRITTFFDVEEDAVSMPDDTMHNPSGSPSIPVGATVIMRPREKYKIGSIVAVIVPGIRLQTNHIYDYKKISHRRKTRVFKPPDPSLSIVPTDT